MPALASAAISSSGANIWVEVLLELSGEAAQPNGLLQSNGHGPLRVSAPGLRPGRVVASDPRVSRIRVGHRADRSRTRGLRRTVSSGTVARWHRLTPISRFGRRPS